MKPELLSDRVDEYYPEEWLPGDGWRTGLPSHYELHSELCRDPLSITGGVHECEPWSI